MVGPMLCKGMWAVALALLALGASTLFLVQPETVLSGGSSLLALLRLLTVDLLWLCLIFTTTVVNCILWLIFAMKFLRSLVAWEMLVLVAAVMLGVRWITWGASTMVKLLLLLPALVPRRIAPRLPN